MKRKLLILCLIFLSCGLSLSSNLIQFDMRDMKGNISENDDFVSLEQIRSAGTGILQVSNTNYPACHTWAKKGDIISFIWYTDPFSFVDFWIMEESDYKAIGTGFLTGYRYFPAASRNSDFTVPSDGKWYLMFCHPSPQPTNVYFSIDTTPYLMIHAPHSDTSTYSDSSIDVQWRTNYATWVRLDLYKGSSFITTLIESTYNDGTATI